MGDRTHDKIASALTQLAPKFLPDLNMIELTSGKSVLALRFPGGTGFYRYGRSGYVRIAASNHEISEDQYQKRVLEQFHGSNRWGLRPSGLTLDDIEIAWLLRLWREPYAMGV